MKLDSWWCIRYFFFLNSRKPHLPENVLCGLRRASKIPTVPSSYKRCTSWLELKTCVADLKPFIITPRSLNYKQIHATLLKYMYKENTPTLWHHPLYCPLNYKQSSLSYTTWVLLICFLSKKKLFRYAHKQIKLGLYIKWFSSIFLFLKTK
jgi:hypothetical protein